ncbi:hypothetical protein GW17_00039270 [Ensete ventricosum]|nr:hypothetical protein GW17_00039270 [Ensete ventricosum]
MPLGKYYCDYCDKQFQDTPAARKRHLQGLHHHRARALWYDSFKERMTNLESRLRMIDARELRLVWTKVAGTRTARYRAVPPKFDRRRSILAVGGRLREKSTVDGRLREKSTVGGRLSEKKGRRRRRGKEEKREEERIPSARAQSSPARRCRLCAVLACALSSPARRPRSRAVTARMKYMEAIQFQNSFATNLPGDSMSEAETFSSVAFDEDVEGHRCLRSSVKNVTKKKPSRNYLMHHLFCCAQEISLIRQEFHGATCLRHCDLLQKVVTRHFYFWTGDKSC